jgi:cytochrome c-type biogenesis protein CcmF
MLNLWMLAVAQFSRHLPQPVVARILAVMGLVSLGFLLFMLLTSNPFERLLPAAPDGRDLNPLLQDPGMVIHPPMLYMGYVGFSVAFSFAIAALIGGNLDSTWARWTRPWTTAAWIFLTLGIALGSWWAYYELGWGGWWFWDPVENASFMPWLAGTALMHSLAVTEKRGAFKSWTVLLAIMAFSLSLLGTFLVRSGVLSSVHAFATDPKRGVFILAFLAVVIGGSLALFAWRAPKVGLGARFGAVSRESMLLGNNVMLVVAMATVLLGTLYPLVLDALGLGKISVGPPYFDTVFALVMTPVVFLMGVGPLARWRQAELPELARRLRWAAGLTVVAALLTGWIAGHISLAATLGFLMTWWIVFSVATDLFERLRPGVGAAGGVMARLRLLPRSVVSMTLAHLGIAVFAFGVSMVKTYDIEKDLKMDVGDTAEIAGYVFTYRGVRDVQGPNYVAAQGLVEVTRDGKPVTSMRPEKRVYRVQQNPMTEAAINTGFTRDLYVSLGEAVEGQAWIVRFYYKPFVDWIWGGCVLMALGGIVAVTDRRYRARRSETAKVELAPLAPEAT